MLHLFFSRRSTFFVSLFLLLFLSFKCYSQPSVQFKHFDKNTGLKSSTGTATIRTDSDDNIWIVKFQGLTRYDGKEFIDWSISGIKKGIFIRFYENKKHEKTVVDHRGQLFFIEDDQTFSSYKWNDTIRNLFKKASICRCVL